MVLYLLGKIHTKRPKQSLKIITKLLVEWNFSKKLHQLEIEKITQFKHILASKTVHNNLFKYRTALMCSQYSEENISATYEVAHFRS